MYAIAKIAGLKKKLINSIKDFEKSFIQNDNYDSLNFLAALIKQKKK